MRSWIRQLSNRPVGRTIRKVPYRGRPALEALEDRCVPSTMIVVNNPTDTPVAGETDLRQAILQANANGGDQTIVFDPTVFQTPQTITLNGSPLELSDTTGTETITGPTAGVTVNGGGLTQVFQIDGGVTASLSGLTIAGGNSPSLSPPAQWGGGLHNSGSLTMTDCTVSGNSAPIAGGVYNSGSLTMTDCTVSGNTVVNSFGGGGGLFNSGALTMTDCTVSGNSDVPSFGGGGGVANDGTVTLTNCTISGNSATSGTGGVYNTGSFYNHSTATLTNCTVSDNSTNSSVGGVNNNGPDATLTLTNTIVAGNQNATGVRDLIESGPVSGNNNLIGLQGPGGFVNGVDGNIVGVVNPLLAPLRNYGGPTQTMALLPGSPAIDAGSGGTGIPATDQRGLARVGPVDIGAFESQGFILTGVASSSPQTATIGTAFANPLAVTVTPINPGEPVNGGRVNFVALPAANGASAIFSTSSAVISSGQAAVTAAPDNADGSYEVVAAVAGSSASFSLTNVGPVYANLVVNTTSDSLAPGAGLLSLREAIGFANNDRSGNTSITFDPTVFANAQTITLTLGQLELSNTSETETITGPAAGLTVNGGGKSQVLLVDGGVTASLSNLTITGGSSPLSGGGVNNAGSLALANCTISGNSAQSGGGVGNAGSLALTNCTVSSNSASYGGGVDNAGSLALTACTVSGNSAQSGGGVDNAGSLQLINCTVFGNSASGFQTGGGVENAGSLALTNCTVSGNFAQEGGGGLNSIKGTTTLGNTIVAGNTVQFGAPDVGISGTGLLTSQGNNLIGKTDGSSGWVSSDLTGTKARPLDAELAPLGNYGGSTQTMPELFGSPAIGAGNINLVPADITTDQRGQPRFFNGKVDIGAYQLQVVLVPSFVVNTTSDFSDPSDGKTTLREAIASANALPGHTITFDPTVFANPQTITLTGSPLELSAVTGTETIQGSQAGVTVNGGGKSQVFLVDGGVTASLSNLTITGGNSPVNGGGVENAGSLALTNCTVSGNSASGGGGVFNSGSLALTNCTVSGNSTGHFGDGGGVFNSGSLSLSNCTVSGNSSYGGCGLFNSYAATATLTNCTVTGNTSTGKASKYGGVASGGGVFNSGSLTLTGCTVSNNYAVFGGGVYNLFGTASLANCTVSGNNAGIGGGGVFDFLFATTTLTNCTVSGNSTLQAGPFGGGGGVYNGFLSSLTLTNCTVSGNIDSNGSGGGGVFNNVFSTAMLTNCTVSGNSTSGDGGGVDNTGPANRRRHATVTLTNCTVSGNSASEGGGLYNGGGGANQATLTNCTVSGNSATAGGGLFNQSTLNVASSNVLKNTATSKGGGISTTGGSATITDSVINANQVNSSGTALGGGIDCENSVLSLTDCTVNANRANGTNAYGGGIYALNSTVNAQSCTVNGNQANGSVMGEGGGIYSFDSPVTLVASIVKGNKATTAYDDIFSGP
jgi:CSLREA domain-containing protein